MHVQYLPLWVTVNIDAESNWMHNTYYSGDMPLESDLGSRRYSFTHRANERTARYLKYLTNTILIQSKE